MRSSFGHLLLLVALLTMAVRASSPAGEQQNVTNPLKFRQVNVITAPLKPCPEGQRRDLQDNCREIISNSPGEPKL